MGDGAPVVNEDLRLLFVSLDSFVCRPVLREWGWLVIDACHFVFTRLACFVFTTVMVTS